MLEEYSGTDRSIRKVTDVLNIIEVLKTDKRIKTTDKIILGSITKSIQVII